MNPKSLKRRGFLGGIAALPFLPTLPSLGCGGGEIGSSQAALGGEEPILITMMTPDGVGEGWHPEGAGTDFTLSPAFDALESRRDKLTLFRQVHVPAPPGDAACNHRQSLGLWTGDSKNGGDWDARGPSFDTVVGRGIQNGRPLDVLRMGCQNHGSIDVNGLSFDTDGSWLPHNGSPRRTFTSIFGSAPGGESEDPLRRSILDGIVSDYEGLQRRLGATDRVRLESHLDALRDLERSFATPGIMCDAPGTADTWVNHGGGHDDRSDPELTQAILAANRELTVLALACGHTRTVSLSHLAEGEVGATADYSFLDPRMGNLHQMSHSQRHDLMPIADAFDLAYVASIADRLEEVGLMEQTLFVWGSGLSNGAAHSSIDLPIVLLGDACGRLRTGQLIDGGGRSYNDVILTVLEAFGLGRDTFGDAARCNGAFSEAIA